MAKRTVRDVDWAGKRAFVRVDFNVPFDAAGGAAGDAAGAISDDSRIREALPTLAHLRDGGASVVLGTHRGRPGGVRADGLDLAPIAERLAELLGESVEYVHDAPGGLARERAATLRAGDVLLLENLRFWPGEEANDPAFARSLAALADVYVNDAFGTAHRAHASTEGIAHVLPAVAGLLMERELAVLGRVLDDPKRPLAALLGGAKVSDKLRVLERLIAHADAIYVGGGMAATFLKAKGLPIGASLVEDGMVGACAAMIETAGDSLHLPSDLVVAERIEAGAPTRTVAAGDIPDGWMALDIGPETAASFARELAAMGTVVWNGPMGVFEVPPFDAGTRVVAQALAASSAVTVVGGGSTAEAVAHLGLTDKMTHVSTGGGASLGFLEGRVLPGVAALDDA
ncbi:MAG: phosphoglycerate kinase [Chloroflexi bacterium]|nr:phosphoglycerate kinase [Chloroflexota bacterium]